MNLNDGGGLVCHICGVALEVRLAHGRKSGKTSVMLICTADGRHFRAFITHPDYVRSVLARLEESAP